MYKQENSQILSLYAISPVHAGSGSSTGVVDLPIQRERHTQWPHIQASGVKGAMRAHFDKFKSAIKNSSEIKQIDKITEMIFGSDKFEGGDADEKILPGAIAVSDAKLLAFPMRSNVSPFVWITCPAVLKRLVSDLKLTGIGEEEKNIKLEGTDAMLLAGDNLSGKILLEDYEVTIKEPKRLSSAVSKFFKKAERLILVSDEVYNYGVANCTEVQTQIKIDQETGTAAAGALRYEELLPADSIMYSVLMYGNTRNKESVPAESLIKYMKDEVIKSHIQIGGDETLGRGLFEIEWVSKGDK